MIHYRGLNCHLACVVNIAAALGVDAREAYATLWSETDFEDDAACNLYLSKRVLANMEALGVKTDILRCASPEEAAENLSLIPEGDLFSIGTDLFFVPWCPASGAVHGPHYLYARRDADAALCFDPTYGVDGARMRLDDVLPHAFELGRMQKIAAVRPRSDVGREAREILSNHPGMREELLAEIGRCGGPDRKAIGALTKRIDAMINNRHLFARYLYPAAHDAERPHFGKAFFARWEAVKNGLLKAHVIRDNAGVLAEVRALLNALIDEEIAIADELALRR